MLTKDEIELGYRLFLGRDPENLSVILNAQQNISTYDELREYFLDSHEFLEIVSHHVGTIQNIRLRHPLLPRIPVQLNVSPDELDKIFSRISNQWNKLGELDPYWSVLTKDQFRITNFNSNREDFFGSGKYPVDVFLASLRRLNINIKNLKSCLDFGCGVGRVLLYLSPHFNKVYGYDISKSHLVIAKKYFDFKKISNAELFHIENMRFMNFPKVDAIFSIITLQHNPPPVIKIILMRILNALLPSGVAFIQIPTYQNGYIFEIERYLNSETSLDLEMHFFPQNEIFKIIDESNCICLEVREDGMISEDKYSLSNTFIVQKLY